MEKIKIDSKTLDISPDPFTCFTVITIPEEIILPYSLDLFDINGEKVYSQSNIVSNKFILGRKNLHKGIYFYKVFNLDYSYLDTGKITLE